LPEYVWFLNRAAKHNAMFVLKGKPLAALFELIRKGVALVPEFLRQAGETPGAVLSS
jgi:hypothetical protein